MTDSNVSRLVEAARAVLDELHPWGDRSGWTPAIADKLDALDSALAAALTPAPATCGTCGGTREVKKETRAPQVDGRSAVLRYTEDCPACGGGR